MIEDVGLDCESGVEPEGVERVALAGVKRVAAVGVKRVTSLRALRKRTPEHHGQQNHGEHDDRRRIG